MNANRFADALRKQRRWNVLTKASRSHETRSFSWLMGRSNRIFMETRNLLLLLLTSEFLNQKVGRKGSADNFLFSLFNKTNEESFHHFLSSSISELLTNIEPNSLSTCCRRTNEIYFFHPSTEHLPFLFWLEWADCAGDSNATCVSHPAHWLDGFSWSKNHFLTVEERPETPSQQVSVKRNYSRGWECFTRRSVTGSDLRFMCSICHAICRPLTCRKQSRRSFACEEEKIIIFHHRFHLNGLLLTLKQPPTQWSRARNAHDDLASWGRKNDFQSKTHFDGHFKLISGYQSQHSHRTSACSYVGWRRKKFNLIASKANMLRSMSIRWLGKLFVIEFLAESFRSGSSRGWQCNCVCYEN